MKNVFCVAGALGFAAALWSFSQKRNAPAFPPPSALREVRKSAGEDMLALSLGARRLFADLWFIRLMQYYGTPELHDDDSEEPGKCVHALEYGTGDYPEFLPLSRHIAALDPYFKNAILYSAGSLAFNMDRPEEAESLLNYALLNTPRDWKFLTMLTAIGYGKSTDPAKIAMTIAPLVLERDCPVMLKQLAAFLNKKAGNYAAAAGLYEDILKTSKDRFYAANAEKELEKLALRRSVPAAASRRRSGRPARQ